MKPAQYLILSISVCISLFLKLDEASAVQGVSSAVQSGAQNISQSAASQINHIKKQFEYNPVGKPAHLFTNAQTAEGLTVNLADFAGKTVVLEWHNPECPYVQKHYSTNNMQKLQTFARSEKVVWITINSSSPHKTGYIEARDAWDYISNTNSRANHYVIDPNGGIGMAYNALTTPSVVIIDSGGNVAYYGAIDDRASSNPDDVPIARNYVQQALNSLLLGMPASPSATMPYGCPVKYPLVPDN
jgi:peroxiredoxin